MEDLNDARGVIEAVIDEGLDPNHPSIVWLTNYLSDDYDPTVEFGTEKDDEGKGPEYWAECKAEAERTRLKQLVQILRYAKGGLLDFAEYVSAADALPGWTLVVRKQTP
jgi:hypothetical protein